MPAPPNSDPRGKGQGAGPRTAERQWQPHACVPLTSPTPPNMATLRRGKQRPQGKRNQHIVEESPPQLARTPVDARALFHPPHQWLPRLEWGRGLPQTHPMRILGLTLTSSHSDFYFMHTNAQLPAGLQIISGRVLPRAENHLKFHFQLPQTKVIRTGPTHFLPPGLEQLLGWQV